MGSHRRSRREVVLGVGNYVLGDDGAGVHAVRAFRAVRPAGVAAIDAGTAVWRLETLLASTRLLIVFDALRAGGAPGTIYATGLAGSRAGTLRVSLHEHTLQDVLDAMPRRPEGVVIGIEPATIDYGCDLSAPVAAALPAAIRWAVAIIGRWRAGPAAPLASGDWLLDWLAARRGITAV